MTPLGIAMAPKVAETGQSGNRAHRAIIMVAPVKLPVCVKLGRGIKPSRICAIPNARQKWQAHEDSCRLKREEFPP